MRSLYRSLLLAAAVLVFGTVPAQAQDFPSKPITMIVPWNAGGGMDVFARILEPILVKELGQPFAFVYKPGASGSIGAAAMLAAKPDGYTICTNMLDSQFLNPLLGVGNFNVEDSAPITIFAEDANVMCVLKDSPFKTLADVEKAAKANPGKIVVGCGDRSGQAVALLMQKRGIPVKMVPFVSGVKAGTALLSKQIDVCIHPVGAFMNTVRDRADVLALAAGKRSPLLPDVPTTVEQGYDDLRADAGRGFFCHKDVPDAVKARLSAAFEKACTDPTVVERARNSGIVIDFNDYKASAEKLKGMMPRFENTAALFKSAQKK